MSKAAPPDLEFWIAVVRLPRLIRARLNKIPTLVCAFVKDIWNSTYYTVSVIWRIVTICSVALSISAFYLLLVPRLSITPGVSTDTLRPFATKFVLSKLAGIPISQVRYVCEFDSIQPLPPGFSLHPFYRDSNLYNHLDSDPISIYCNHSFGFKIISSAKLFITVFYTTLLPPFVNKHTFGFMLLRDAENNALWIADPVDQPCLDPSSYTPRPLGDPTRPYLNKPDCGEATD